MLESIARISIHSNKGTPETFYLDIMTSVGTKWSVTAFKSNRSSYLLHSLKQKHRHCEFSGSQYLSVFLPTHTEQMDVYSPLVHLSFGDFWLIFDHYDWTRHFDLDVVLYGWFCLLPSQKHVLQFSLALPSPAFLDLLFLFLSLKKKKVML